MTLPSSSKYMKPALVMLSSQRQNGSKLCFDTLIDPSISSSRPSMDMQLRIGTCLVPRLKSRSGGAFQTKRCMRATLDSFIQALAAKVIITGVSKVLPRTASKTSSCLRKMPRDTFGLGSIPICESNWSVALVSLSRTTREKTPTASTMFTGQAATCSTATHSLGPLSYQPLRQRPQLYSRRELRTCQEW
jgi:hypothetical protein